MYDRGQYITQDYAQAVSWYLKAAEQGNANAQYNLALKYQMGQGVIQDDTKAAYWYRKAAEEGLQKNNSGLKQGIDKPRKSRSLYFSSRRSCLRGEHFLTIA